MPLLCISLLCPNSRVSKLSELVASGLKPIWIKRGCRIRWVHRYGRKSQSNPFAHFHCLRCQTHHIVPSLSLNHQQLHPISEDDPARFWSGPLPGDLSEVEAFCRLFRLSEQLHNAVMDALNSLNRSRREETTVSDNKDGVLIDNSQFSDGEDIPLLEQKVVAGLGCIGALLRQHKQEVLAGRVSCSTALDGMDDSRPPLASFRAEMKRCCKQLGPALYCYFPPVDEQSILIHRRFQKLMNACFDVGYPRPERAPSHDDIPNWAAVQLWTGKGGRNSETEEEVLFWRGGQLTEDGLSWLLDKGFKLIVDLRAEDSMNQLAEVAVADAICSSRLRLVRLPVEPGTAPAKEQVKAFAELVTAPENHPLYLQSCEGAGRTSAMVSRWRELTIHKTLQTESDFSSKTGNGSTIKCKKQESSKTKVEIGSDIQKTEAHLEKNVHKKLEADASSMSDIFSSEVSSSTKQNDKNCLSEIEREDLYNNMHGRSNILNGQESRGEKVQKRLIVGRVNPFEAQRPKDILSKQAMSEFRKGRRVVPSEFTSGIGERETHASVAFPTEKERIYDTGVIAGPAGRWGLAGPGIPRAGADGLKMEPSSEVHCQEQDNHNLSYQILKTPDKVAKNAEGSVTELFNSQYNENNSIPGSSSPVLKLVTEDSPDDDGDELSVSGDMCASTTGVVRIQSRKKAEMYLVRTDGFSCTRERVKESTLAFTHPSTQQQMLMWKTAPRTVLLLIKLGNELMAEAQQVASFLHYEEGINVVVEPEVHDYFARFPGFGFIQTFYSRDTSYLHERVDFVVCLGGDGLVLHASDLFRNAVPPIVAFNLGSLGFLTAHAFEDFSQDLRAIIHGNNRVEGVYITLRMRLRCELFRDGKPIPGKVFDVLNEVVVDRGSSPYLCKIECYERNRLITKVQADGVIVATPTGSTAYSTAAGGSMVHPNVPCILFTPICPHSLSFRPVILPDSALLELKIPGDARSNAWVSFDGKRRQQLCKGDSIRVGMSKHPLPTVNKSDQTDDWFCSLVRCLNWNERFEQKSLKY